MGVGVGRVGEGVGWKQLIGTVADTKFGGAVQTSSTSPYHNFNYCPHYGNHL